MAEFGGDRVLTTRWSCGAESRIGSGRRQNMDAYLVWPARGVVVLADGIGSTVGGREAAQLAARAFSASLLRADAAGIRGDADTRGEAVRVAVAAAQQRVLDRFGGRPLAGSTTLCAAILGRHGLTVVNVGDSRGHRWRAGVLTTMTHDHTVAAHLVAVGAAQPGSELALRTANQLRRYVGRAEGVTADVTEHDLLPEDVVVLTSDGVHGLLSNERMAPLVDAPPAAAARALVDAAVTAGGTDDATAVVVRAR